jgi:hypothetical protein
LRQRLTARPFSPAQEADVVAATSSGVLPRPLGATARARLTPDALTVLAELCTGATPDILEAVRPLVDADQLVSEAAPRSARSGV